MLINVKTLIITNSFMRDVDLVERSLNASLSQEPSADYVYFIDQNPEKLVLSKAIENNPKFSHFHVLTNCVSTARNSVTIPSDVDWVFFCDDDGYPMEGYLSKLLEVIKLNQGVEIIAGSIIRDDNLDYYSPRHKMGGDLNQFRNTKLLMGSNFSCKAEVFKKLEGFDENFGAGSFWGSGEETDFAWKAYFNQVPMLYEKELKVFHVKPYAQTFSQNVNKAFRYGVGKGALVSKWLFRHFKFQVLYEVFEMTTVPIIQMIKSFVTFKWLNIPVYLSSLISRYYGMIIFLIYRNKGRS